MYEGGGVNRPWGLTIGRCGLLPILRNRLQLTLGSLAQRHFLKLVVCQNTTKAGLAADWERDMGSCKQWYYNWDQS
jgi:hypothetical protein